MLFLHHFGELPKAADKLLVDEDHGDGLVLVLLLQLLQLLKDCLIVYIEVGERDVGVCEQCLGLLAEGAELPAVDDYPADAIEAHEK